MPIITVWKWKNLNEDEMGAAMDAVTRLDYPEGYQNWVFADGSGGVSISPDDEDPAAGALRSHVFSKWLSLEVHHAMSEEEGMVLGAQVIEVLKTIDAD